jgi:hypothetical protein
MKQPKQSQFQWHVYQRPRPKDRELFSEARETVAPWVQTSNNYPNLALYSQPWANRLKKERGNKLREKAGDKEKRQFLKRAKIQFFDSESENNKSNQDSASKSFVGSHFNPFWKDWETVSSTTSKRDDSKQTKSKNPHCELKENTKQSDLQFNIGVKREKQGDFGREKPHISGEIRGPKIIEGSFSHMIRDVHGSTSLKRKKMKPNLEKNHRFKDVTCGWANGNDSVCEADDEIDSAESPKESIKRVNKS